MKKASLILCLTFTLCIFPLKAYADSSYVLPYPSFMPGSKFYSIQKILESLSYYWYFGDFGQFNYNLRESDKYLVEAKILFDYKQYFLGHKALISSDKYFAKINPTLVSARRNNKNISEKEKILKEAAAKHIEELSEMKEGTPENFNWVPEKDKPTFLSLWQAIDNAISIREKAL